MYTIVRDLTIRDRRNIVMTPYLGMAIIPTKHVIKGQDTSTGLTLLQRRLSSRLEWQEKSEEAGNEEEDSRDINRDRGREVGV